jgi:hypothetical protein
MTLFVENISTSKVLLNSSASIEEEWVNALRSQFHSDIHAIGPLFLHHPHIAQPGSLEFTTLMANHPPSSVIYISMGTTPNADLSVQRLSDLLLAIKPYPYIWSLSTRQQALLPKGTILESDKHIIRPWTPQKGIQSA